VLAPPPQKKEKKVFLSWSVSLRWLGNIKPASIYQSSVLTESLRLSAPLSASGPKCWCCMTDVTLAEFCSIIEGYSMFWSRMGI
jgi:hypothetical protein